MLGNRKTRMIETRRPITEDCHCHWKFKWNMPCYIILLTRNRFHTYAIIHNSEKSAATIEIANKERLLLQVIQLDVNDNTSIINSIEKIVSEKERTDVLVNNAGSIG